MIIIDQPKLIYLAVPRTASTAISRALRDVFPDCRRLGHHRMRIPKSYNRDEYFIFAGVRNPYERMASHYLHRHRVHAANVGHWSFREYIDYLVNDRLGWFGLMGDPPATQWLSGTDCQHVIRFERLREDWAALPVWQELGQVPRLRKRNASSRSRNNWRLLYTRDLADRVYDHQREDFETWGYDRESWRLGYLDKAA